MYITCSLDFSHGCQSFPIVTITVLLLFRPDEIFSEGRKVFAALESLMSEVKEYYITFRAIFVDPIPPLSLS